jgi:hypothetical protein
MNDRESRFTPEAIEEQTVRKSAELVSEESLLVQQIYTLSQSYAHKNEQSLERIWERLQQSQEQRALLLDKQMFLERRTMNKNDTVQRTDMPPTSERGTRLSLPTSRPPRKFKRRLTLAVAVLAAALLIGAILSIVPHTYQPGGVATAGSTPTPRPTPAPTLIPGTPFPEQDCPSPYDASVPSTRWATWYQLCKAGMFVTVNQSRSLAKHSTESILAAYADQNAFVLISDLSPLKAADVVNVQNTSITEMGTLEAFGGSYGFNTDQHRYMVSAYDTSNLPASLRTLTVTIHSRVGLPGDEGGASLEAAAFASFSMPLHSAKTLTPNQTITANQTSITLSKVVIGASGIHIVFAASHLPDVALSHGFQGILQSGKISVSHESYGLLTTKGSMVATGFTLVFDSNQSASHDAWTLRVTSADEPQPWIFHFTVPA